MKLRLIYFFLFLPTNFLYCQNYTSIWKMGYNGGGGCYYFNFDSIPLSIVTEARGMNFLETNASICNAQGQINFYTNGVYIANANNDTMMNGSGLNPGTYATTWANFGLLIGQADIILPFPDDSMKFYLFHETSEYVGTNYQPKNLFQSIVDMSLDGGLGAVTIKNNSIIQDTLIYGELTACKHANGRDWWLICHRFTSNDFYKLLITPNGIESITTQSIGSHIFVGGGGRLAFLLMATGMLVTILMMVLIWIFFHLTAVQGIFLIPLMFYLMIVQVQVVLLSLQIHRCCMFHQPIMYTNLI